MARKWVCSCGQEWPEDGSGKGLKAAWNHQMKFAREGHRAEHIPVGLVDTETGEILQENFSTRRAVFLGLVNRLQKGEDEETEGVTDYSAPDDDSEDEDEDEEEDNTLEEVLKRAREADEKTAAKKAQKGRPRQGPVIGRVPVIQITIPPELYFLFVLTQSKYEGFSDTAESFTEWLTYCVIKLHTLYPEVFGLKDFLAQAVKDRGIAVGHSEK